MNYRLIYFNQHWCFEADMNIWAYGSDNNMLADIHLEAL